ncbi:MAG: hypothetical protein M0Z93_04045 [Actinomycetota bacterium]|nr:hypothetical protein [Actinomycetota bacterium]
MLLTSAATLGLVGVFPSLAGSAGDELLTVPLAVILTMGAASFLPPVELLWEWPEPKENTPPSLAISR